MPSMASDGGTQIVVKEYKSPSDIKVFHESWKESVNFNRYMPSLESLENLKNRSRTITQLSLRRTIKLAVL